MIYGSVCSGIEAATVAWEALGWRPAWFSQYDPDHDYKNGLDFPSKVLKHHYPSVVNLGDMTRIYEKEEFKNIAIKLLVGGTPCQSFSIAGLRGGLADQRGNLALEYCRILIAKQPEWFVWENVPGVYSSFSDVEESKISAEYEYGEGYDCTQTADFATLLQGFRECGYCVAYRVFDAQYFGVPQRRRRVFVVGYLGNDWRPPAAVLLESESLRRDYTPSKEPGKEVAGTLDARTKGGGFPGTDGALNGHIISGTITSRIGRGADDNHGEQNQLIVMAHGQGGAEITDNLAPTLNCNHEQPIVFDFTQISSTHNRSNPQPGDPSGTITKNSRPVMVLNDQGGGVMNVNNDGTTGTLRSQTHGHEPIIIDPLVRRLTPLECERLQGFPDNYTCIPGSSDTKRYAALGNSMAIPVMKWLGMRIDKVDKILKSLK